MLSLPSLPHPPKKDKDLDGRSYEFPFCQPPLIRAKPFTSSPPPEPRSQPSFTLHAQTQPQRSSWPRIRASRPFKSTSSLSFTNRICCRSSVQGSGFPSCDDCFCWEPRDRRSSFATALRLKTPVSHGGMSNNDFFFRSALLRSVIHRLALVGRRICILSASNPLCLSSGIRDEPSVAAMRRDALGGVAASSLTQPRRATAMVVSLSIPVDQDSVQLLFPRASSLDSA